MATTFERALGYATIAGTTILTVTANQTVTLIGYTFNNVTTEAQNLNFKIVNTENPSGIEVAPSNIPLPAGSGFAPSEIGKIVLKDGDSLVVYSDTDAAISVVISYMLQDESVVAVINSSTVTNIVVVTQAEYDALVSPDPNVIYIIQG